MRFLDLIALLYMSVGTTLTVLYMSVATSSACSTAKQKKGLIKNKMHPSKIRFLRLRSYEKNYKNMCPAETTQAYLKNRVLDSIADEHNFTSFCAISPSTVGFILKDSEPGPVQLFARCPAIPNDLSYYSLMEYFRDCNIRNMRSAWVTFSSDVRQLAQGNWKKMLEFHLNFWCASVQLINVNCIESVRSSLFHESILHVLNQLTLLELAIGEVPYTGISLIIAENKKANDELIKDKMCYMIGFVIILIIWFCPIKEWTSKQSGIVATIFGAFTKLVDVIRLPIFLLIANICRVKTAISWAGFIQYMIELSSWINSVVSAEAKKFQRIRSCCYDSFARRTTPLNMNERALATGTGVSQNIGINAQALQELGVTDATETSEIWMKSNTYRLVVLVAKLVNLAVAETAMFFVITGLLGITTSEGFGILQESWKDGWTEFQTNIETSLQIE